MRRTMPSKRAVVVGLGGLALLAVAVAGGGWLLLTHRPNFYRQLVAIPPAQREAKARRFVAGSLQLRNDISNERTWQAVFSDQEVNAWLAEDLVAHFADQIPPQVREPRVAFEADRVTLAFEFDGGPVSSVVWIVARVRVPEENVVALTIEKVRAGVIPVPFDRFIGPIVDRAREAGLDVRWDREDGRPVALIRYRPDGMRSDVVLERLAIRQGQIRLSGRSDRLQGAFVAPMLPGARVLQLNFPRRNSHRRGSSSSLRSSTSPTS